MLNNKASEATTESLPVLGAQAGRRTRGTAKKLGRSVVVVPPDPSGEGTDCHISSTVLNAVESKVDTLTESTPRYRRDIRSCRQKISDKTSSLVSRVSTKIVGGKHRS